MDTINIQAIPTASFVFVESLAPWAYLYPLANCRFRSYMRQALGDPVVLYQWSTDNGRITFYPTNANGQITFAANPPVGSSLVLDETTVTFTDYTTAVLSGSGGLIEADSLIVHGSAAVAGGSGMSAWWTGSPVPARLAGGGLLTSTVALRAMAGATLAGTGGMVCAGGSPATTVQNGATLEDTLEILVQFLSMSSDDSISKCSYSISDDTLNIVYSSPSLDGNNFGIGVSGINATVSNPLLAGAGGILTMESPIGDLTGFLGDYVYDVRMETPDNRVVQLFGGTLSFVEAVTR